MQMKETRTEQVMTRLTMREKTRLEKQAKKWHMTISSYLQFLIQKAK